MTEKVDLLAVKRKVRLDICLKLCYNNNENNFKG